MIILKSNTPKQRHIFLNLCGDDEKLYDKPQDEEAYMMYGIPYAVLVDSRHLLSNHMPDSRMLAFYWGVKFYKQQISGRESIFANCNAGGEDFELVNSL